MLGRTHLAAGAIAGEAVATVGHHGLSGLAIGAVVGMASAWLPDIAKVGSGVGRSIPLGWIPGLVLKHRGLTHMALVGGLYELLWARWAVPRAHLPPWLALAAGAGYATHLLLDLPTDNGIPLLWPLVPTRVGRGLLSTGGVAERLGVFPALALLLAWCTWVWR